MKLQSLWTGVFTKNHPLSNRQERSSRHRRFRLETLESRQVLSTLVVQSTADSGVNTLREAITQANANPAYNDIFIDIDGTINLSSALPVLTGNYKIEGPGANQLEIENNGTSSFRIFNVAAGANIEIDRLTIAQGNAPSTAALASVGGGIYNQGNLTLDSVEVFHNAALLGGGLFNAGNATVIDSTFDSNVSVNGDAGAYFGGGYSQLTMINSTVSNNYASGPSAMAGGLTLSESASATLEDCTITNNYSHFGSAVASTMPTGAGIRVLYNLSDHTQGDVTLYNTIVAGNYNGINNGVNGPADDIAGPVDQMSRYNLIGNGDATWGIADANGGNKVGTAAPNGPHYFIELGPLQNNGGTTPTNALLMGSDAINAGSNDYAAPQPTDQTGRNRIVNNQIDIGAYEYQPGSDTIHLVASPTPVSGQVVTLTATVTATTPGSNPVTGVVTFYVNSYDTPNFLAQVPVINGKAVLSNVKLPAGTTLVGAQYEGNSTFFAQVDELKVTGAAAGGLTATPASGSTATGSGAPAGTGASGGTSTALKVVLGQKNHHPHHVVRHVVQHGKPHPRHGKR